MQTDLKSNAFCSYNQSASPFYWAFQPGQYNAVFAVGEVGVNALGGSAGSYVQPAVIDISSFLSGRDDVLSRCVPPTPSLDSLNQPVLYPQDQIETDVLLPQYTKTKRSSNDLDAVDYNRWQPNLNWPQNLRFSIEGFANSDGRIGMNTQNYTKLAWKPGSFNYSDPEICKTTLRPGVGNSVSNPINGVTGYPGINPLTGDIKVIDFQWPGKPPGQEDYPFTGITSQQIYSVGASSGGPQFNYGYNYDEGSQPITNPTMLQGTALSPDEFPLRV